MNYKARRATSLIFGLISAIGTVATAILVAKETPKALKKIEELKSSKKTSKKDYIKALVPIYWPAGAICLGTIISTTVSQIISIRTEASLIATTTLLSQGWNKYKYKVKEFLGPTGEKLIRADIAKDSYSENKENKKLVSEKGSKKLYYEEHIGWFYADPVELQAGLEDINQRLYTPDNQRGCNEVTYWATLYWFIKDSKATVLDKDRLECCQDIGWTVEYLSEMYVKRFVWVHPEFTRVFNKDTGELLYTMLTFEEEPIALNIYGLQREYDSFKKTGKYDYLHEAESDLAFQDDVAALDLEFGGDQRLTHMYVGDNEDRRGPVYARNEVYYKEYEDDEVADQIFSSSSPTNKEHVTNVYSDGSVIGAATDRVEYDLPDIKELQSLEGK